MSELRRLPEIPADALRDQGSDERVERIWQRLEPELGPARPRSRNVMIWAPATLAIVFASGVFVGSRWFRAIPATPAQVAAEPTAVEERAAGPTPFATQPGKADERDPSKGKKGTPLLPHSSAEPAETAPPSVGELPPAPTALVPVEQPEWIVLSKSYDYKGASAALDRQGGFDAVLGKASAAQKMTLVDIARDNRQNDRAMKALRSILEQNPNDPVAPLAALTLGSMLEKMNDRAGASKAYAAYRQMAPKGEFAEDALARQFDSALGQGDVAQAKKLADQYLKDYPGGRRVNDIRAKVAKLSPGAAPAKPEARPDSGSTPVKVEDDTPYDEVDEEPVPPPKR